MSALMGRVRVARGVRRAQVIQVLEAAGPAGMTPGQVAVSLGLPPRRLYTLLAQYRADGLCWSVGAPRDQVRYVATSAAPPPPEAVTTRGCARKEKRASALQRIRAAALRVNQECASPASAPFVPRVAPLAEPVVRMLAGGVKLTLCPSGLDTRYTAAPGYLGEFMADWRARREGVAA